MFLGTALLAGFLILAGAGAVAFGAWHAENRAWFQFMAADWMVAAGSGCLALILWGCGAAILLGAVARVLIR